MVRSRKEGIKSGPIVVFDLIFLKAVITFFSVKKDAVTKFEHYDF